MPSRTRPNWSKFYAMSNTEKSTAVLRDRAVARPPVREGTEQETSSQGERDAFVLACTIRSIALGDEHEARATELDLIDDRKRARWVRSCSNPRSPTWLRCKVRQCPSCSRDVARRNARKMGDRIDGMQAPKVVLVTLSSFGLHDLAETISTFHKLFGRLRRRKCFRSVRSGVAGLEVKLADNGARWLVHIHAVVDAEVLDAVVLATTWKRMTDSRGTFGLHPSRPNVAAEHRRLDAYATKAATWCPPPGSLRLPLLRSVCEGVRGRRLLLSWGIPRLRVERARGPRRNEGRVADVVLLRVKSQPLTPTGDPTVSQDARAIDNPGAT